MKCPHCKQNIPEEIKIDGYNWNPKEWKWVKGYEVDKINQQDIDDDCNRFIDNTNPC
jgi:hypothetical protein